MISQNKGDIVQRDELQEIADNIQGDIETVNQKIELLFGLMRSHFHDGNESARILISSLSSLFETISTVPTFKPTSIYDQIKRYKSGTDDGMYIYDATNDSWDYFARVVKQAAISKPAGGATVDSEARTAIDTIIDDLKTLGLTS